jgi:hypothetical protein
MMMQGAPPAAAVTMYTIDTRVDRSLAYCSPVPERTHVCTHTMPSVTWAA